MTKKLKSAINGIVRGITSTASIYEKTKYPSLNGSDLDRMRGDVVKVGGRLQNRNQS